MVSEERTRDAREKAVAALTHFALLAGKEHLNEFVVIGGLNPDFLAPKAPTLHAGTTDVDLLFEIGLLIDRDEYDFSWLDRVMQSLSIESHDTEGGWRWVVELGDSITKIELLSDVPDNPGQTIALPGTKIAATKNFTGPGPALIAPITREIEVPHFVREKVVGAAPSVKLRFANLGGYLLAKAAAVQSRNLRKDVYDLLFVILYNDGGPEGAAKAVFEQLGRMEPHINRQGALENIQKVMEKSAVADSFEAAIFAKNMINAGDDEPELRLKQDACFAAKSFLDAYSKLDS